MLTAYYFKWPTGHPAPEQCEGCAWVTSQVRELLYFHSSDVTYDVLPRPIRRERQIPRVHRLADVLVLGAGLARQSLGWTPVGPVHIVCYLRQESNVFETY